MSCAATSQDTAYHIGNVLSGSWELTQKIFENLSFREVSRVRSVCRTWADVGAKILEKRRKLHYLTIHPHSIPTTEGKPRYCLAFCSEDWSSKPEVFNIKEESGKLTLLQYLSGSLPSSCDFGLVSATGVIGTVENNYQGHCLESANNLNQEILSFLHQKEPQGRKPNRWCRRSEESGSQKPEETSQKTSPPQKEAASVNSSSSSSTDTKDVSVNKNEKRPCVGYSIEVEQISDSMHQTDAVSLILIPHHPGVQLKFFNLCDVKFLKEYRKDEDMSCDNLTISADEFNHLTSLSQDDHLKALLVQNHKVALGGGIADCLYAGRSNSFSQSSFGVAVSGPNVMAASVIIPKYVDNPKVFEEYMKELKSCGLPEDQSVAFMFTCCGRGYYWYRRRGKPWFDYDNVETKAFRQFFPNTPIFGFFGGGEIGLNHLPKFSRQEEDERAPPKKRKKKMFHQVSTVIVLLSFL
ncbi:F-box only protein 22-like [Homarus americanus]|uniref:F-box only protein 22-like n=1 Tax=Homarus americanus TaxID=6706 RepID=A0A8J5JH30_HOMAM|nr:F-box only protein 22-like [Homarus americanus]